MADRDKDDNRRKDDDSGGSQREPGRPERGDEKPGPEPGQKQDR